MNRSRFSPLLMWCLVFATNIVLTDAAPNGSPSVSVTKNASFPLNNDNSARPGDTITYSGTIQNSFGFSAATGVQFADTIDPNTTFVSNSTKLSPNAVAHGPYNAVGNTPLSVAAASGLLVGVHDLDGVTPDGSLVLTTGTVSTSDGGSATVAADGSFTYTPKTGSHNITDTFTYTVTDTDGLASTGTVSINLGPRVWYVDNSGANGAGTRNSPFNNFAAAITAANASGDYIYLFKGNASYAAGSLPANVNLVGAAVDLTVNTVTVIAGSAANTPTIGGTLTIANNDTVNGLNISSGTSTGLNAPGTTGSHIATTINIGSVTSSTGTAVNLSYVDGAVSLTSVSANGALHGISLSNTTGSLTVTGDGGGANNGSGGTIQNATGVGVSLTGATSNVSLRYMTITNSALSGVSGDAVTGFTLIRSNVTNNNSSNTTNEAGLHFINLLGTCAMTNTMVSGSKQNNIYLNPTSGTLTNLTISGSTIGPNSVGTGANGLSLVTNGSANVTVTLTGSSLVTGNQASGFLTTITTGATATININNCTFQDNNINVDLGSSSTGFKIST